MSDVLSKPVCEAQSSLRWIDTHCHLDAPELALFRAEIWPHLSSSVWRVVVPAVTLQACSAVLTLARTYPNLYFALGIHPMYVLEAGDEDLQILRDLIEQVRNDPALRMRLVAIGEIGLDFFVPTLCTPEARVRQLHFFNAQLGLARAFDLPVLLHIRRAQDAALKALRVRPVQGGIAHAFNGSAQQAERFLAAGFKLGLGGAMTYPRAHNIRRLAHSLADDAWVLETDAPDMLPVGGAPPNTPLTLVQIAACLADLRGASLAEVAHMNWTNASQVLHLHEDFACARPF